MTMTKGDDILYKDLCYKISLIIPVKNEELFIEECLERILKQKYDLKDIEVIIVDGKSSDKTIEKLNIFIKNNNLNKWLVLEDSKIQRASGLNLGINKSKGEIIIRIDSRSLIPVDYISKCVKTLIETGADNVGGVQKPLAKSKKQEAIGLALSHPFGIGNAQFRLGKKSGFVDSVYLGCFKREIFNKVGLFDDESSVISEDSDMNQRIRNAGGKVYLNKDIIIGYYPRDNFKDLSKLYFRYGGARAGNLIKSKKLTSIRQLVAPLFIIIIFTLLFLTFVNYYFFYLLISILSIYLLTDMTVSIYLGFKNKDLLLVPFIIVSFPCLHFPWGAGFIIRLLQKPKLGKYWKN